MGDDDIAAIDRNAALIIHLCAIRNCRPVLIALSSNDALGANAKNLGHLLNTKNVYFVPMGQDAPDIKTKSLIADFSIVPDAVKLALNGKQAEPVFKNL